MLSTVFKAPVRVVLLLCTEDRTWDRAKNSFISVKYFWDIFSAGLYVHVLREVILSVMSLFQNVLCVYCMLAVS